MFLIRWSGSAINEEKTTPTKFFKFVFLTYSAKFGRKVQYVNQLRELSLHMDLERLPIPKEVIEYVSRFVFMVGRHAARLHAFTGLQIRPVFGSCHTESIIYEPDLKSRGRETNFELT
jgi:hypothetical protein